MHGLANKKSFRAQSNTSVDGILREEVCLTYDLEKVSGFPLNQNQRHLLGARR
jgi:hypothetical protein